MLDEQDCDARFGDLGDQVVDLLGLDRVAAGGRLVEQQDARPERQSASDLEALEGAVGQRRSFLLGGAR